MQAIAKQRGREASPIEPWDYLYYAEKVRKAKYDLDQDELKPYFELNNMIAGVVLHGRAALRPDVHRDHRHGAGVPPRRARLGGQGQGERQATSACSTATTSRAPASARARGRSGYRGHETFTGKVRHADHLEQQQLRQGRGRRAGADLARRRRDAVPRVRPRAARPAVRGELSRARRHAARLRRVPVAGPRAVGADAADPRPLRQALQDRQADAAGAGRQGRRVEQVQPGLRAPSSTCRRRSSTWSCTRSPTASIDADAFERETLRAHRRAAARSRCATACRSSTTCSRATRYSAGYYSYLWSEVMDADTREAFAEAGDVFDKTTADKMRKYILAPGNIDRSRRGLPPVPRPRSGRQGAAQEARLPGRRTDRSREPAGYSLRSATIGSTRVARHAGSQQASAAAATTSAPTAAKVGASQRRACRRGHRPGCGPAPR